MSCSQLLSREDDGLAVALEVATNGPLPFNLYCWLAFNLARTLREMVPLPGSFMVVGFSWLFAMTWSLATMLTSPVQSVLGGQRTLAVNVNLYTPSSGVTNSPLEASIQPTVLS